MRAVTLAAMVCVAAVTLVADARAESAQTERSSVAVETAGLAYGAFVGSPRLCVSGSVVVSDFLSIQASPAVVWGQDDLLQIVLPLCLRGTIRLGPLTPYVAAGLELGWGRVGDSESVGAVGPTVEAGGRFFLLGSGFFIEPYVGGAVMFASDGGIWGVGPSLFGGLRVGFGFVAQDRQEDGE